MGFQRIFSWEEYDNSINRLAELIKLDGTLPKYIYGVPRGGLIPAVTLSHKLRSHYTNDPFIADLIVDEICDTGNTLHRMSLLPGGMSRKYAVLHTKLGARFTPNYFGEAVDEDLYVVYPWENPKPLKILPPNQWHS